jgi:hypothetical protein
MAAPQQISFGLGSPANIAWLLSFGLGDYAADETAASAHYIVAVRADVGVIQVTPDVGTIQSR